ncbi:hypothetical protein CABS01_05381 [Colletotrichum abscissum]|uniref:Uncharacterized protein n=1 Tax=Colletotrichum abscissum TaxID=1671311 RepID=A0A9P9XRM3_9PEZI|nr:uncharacterized protein CABS01_05381 [Colletotrichum abscissum]KAI3558713.1 hypothetical protein CABS02_01329 [Colletotrichum abscissum]KAK1520876.1 hypothetical protein CABS01_05381 [Colletotrichum abscissum]
MPPDTPSSSTPPATSENAIHPLYPIISLSDERSKVGSSLQCYDDLTATEKTIPDIWMERHHECSRLWRLNTAEEKEAARAKIWELAFTNWDTNTRVPQPALTIARKTKDSIVKIGVLTEDAKPSEKLHVDDTSIAASDPPPRRPHYRGDDVFLKVEVD